MARKCDTGKYRKRRKREIENKKSRIARQAAVDRQYYEAQRKWRETVQWQWDHDERRLLMQQLIRILRRRLNNSPLYLHMEMLRIFGTDSLFSSRVVAVEPSKLKEALK